MFYGTNFSVGEFLYKSAIPVTIGNLVGGTVFCALPLWFLYGRQERALEVANQTNDEEKNLKAPL